MTSQSEIKWSDKHQRYFRHIIGDDGVILETVWLPEGSVDAIEAEDEASEQSTIPSNPAGEPRQSGRDPASHPDSGDVSDSYSFPQPRPFMSGGYLPTQPDYETPSVLPSSSEGIAQLSEVRPIPEKDLPPVEPPPKWPPAVAPAPAQDSAFESTGSMETNSALHYVFDTTYQRYKLLRYDFLSCQWAFSRWMEADWQPPQPYAQSIISRPWPSGPTSHAGAFNYAGLRQSGGTMPKGRGASLYGTYGQPNVLHYEPVDVSYHVKPKTFFREGRVIAVIMNETAGVNATRSITDYNSSSSINRVKYQDNYVYTNVRRFVVVRQRREFCYACPVFTYSGKATTKRGVRASEHGVIYSEGYQAQLLSGEVGITKPSIAVRMAGDAPPLQTASRIYYGIIHPIQYNVKVKDLGQVPQDQVPYLIGNWRSEDENDSSQDARVTRDAEVSEEEDEEEEAEENTRGYSVPGYEDEYVEDDDTLATDFSRASIG